MAAIVDPLGKGRLVEADSATDAGVRDSVVGNEAVQRRLADREHLCGLGDGEQGHVVSSTTGRPSLSTEMR